MTCTTVQQQFKLSVAQKMSHTVNCCVVHKRDGRIKRAAGLRSKLHSFTGGQMANGNDSMYLMLDSFLPTFSFSYKEVTTF